LESEVVCERRKAVEINKGQPHRQSQPAKDAPVTRTIAAWPTPAFTSCQSTMCVFVLSLPTLNPLIVANGP